MIENRFCSILVQGVYVSKRSVVNGYDENRTIDVTK